MQIPLQEGGQGGQWQELSAVTACSADNCCRSSQPNPAVRQAFQSQCLGLTLPPRCQINKPTPIVGQLTSPTHTAHKPAFSSLHSSQQLTIRVMVVQPWQPSSVVQYLHNSVLEASLGFPPRSRQNPVSDEAQSSNSYVQSFPPFY